MCVDQFMSTSLDGRLPADAWQVVFEFLPRFQFLGDFSVAVVSKTLSSICRHAYRRCANDAALLADRLPSAYGAEATSRIVERLVDMYPNAASFGLHPRYLEFGELHCHFCSALLYGFIKKDESVPPFVFNISKDCLEIYHRPPKLRFFVPVFFHIFSVLRALF